PELRGTGVGRDLVAVAEAFARDCGCERLELTSAAHRREAHRFYEKLGYSPRPVRFTKDLELTATSSATPS
ncbi:MAG TPA: GNAT family N-acetyltransferase, partial [Myxococcales bacterium]|nr:GNAT family N-acetyltransferase [Myxococcales bacterium]